MLNSFPLSEFPPLPCTSQPSSSSLSFSFNLESGVNGPIPDDFTGNTASFSVPDPGPDGSENTVKDGSSPVMSSSPVLSSSPDKRSSPVEGLGSTIFISRLEKEVNKHMIENTFGKFGSISEIKHWNARRYAFVSFLEAANAVKAVKMLNGACVFGKPIYVGWPKRARVCSNSSFFKASKANSLKCYLDLNDEVVKKANLGVLIVDHLPLGEGKIKDFLTSCNATVESICKVGMFGCVVVCSNSVCYNKILEADKSAKGFVMIAPFVEHVSVFS